MPVGAGEPNANGDGADAGAPNMLLFVELSVVAVPKLNGLAASFVLAPNEKDELGTAAAGALLLLPNGDTLGGAELNADTLVEFAFGTALNENAAFVSVAAGATGAPNGDDTLDAKLNADGELPNAGGAANDELLAAGAAAWPNEGVGFVFVFVGALPNMPPLGTVVGGAAVWPKANALGVKLNADGELPNAGGAANDELLAAGLAVWPNENAEFVFVFVGALPNIPPLDAVVVGAAV